MKKLSMSPEMSFDDILVEIKNCNDDVTVVLSEGRYFFKKSLRITENLGHSVTFKANGKVFFDGGIIIKNSLVKKCDNDEILSRIIEADSRKHIYEIDLSSYKIDYAEYGCRGFRRAYVPSANEFYINSEAQRVPIYPKSGDIPITEVTDPGSHPKSADFTMRPATFKYDDPRCDLWEAADDFYVSGYFSESYADDTIKAAKIDTENKTITTTLPHLFSFVAKPHTRWHAINLLEELSCEGEYYIDKVHEKLYFYPVDGTDLSTALLQLSVLNTPMVVLRNTANIAFKGITFENTRGTCIYMDNTENCLIKNCVLRNAGMLAAQIGMGATAMPEGMHDAHGIQHESVGTPKSVPEIVGSWHEMLYQFAAWDNEGGKNNGIQGCEIYNTGTGGVLLCGGNRKKLIPAENYVDNCHIYRTNRLDKTYKAGVNIMGVGNKITHCKIHDMPGFAIYLHGNDHKIHYNEIFDVITEVSDAGAIYWGRDRSEVGNEINFNFIHDIYGSKENPRGICAIYLDDGAGFNLIQGNYFYRVIQSDEHHPNATFGTIFWNWGGQTSVCDNIFVECPNPLRSGNYTNNLFIKEFLGRQSELFMRRMKADEEDISGVDVTSDIWRERYPYLYDQFTGNYREANTIYNNAFPMKPKKWFKNPENLDFTAFSKEDFEGLHLRYVVDPIRKIDNEEVYVKLTDFSKIGLY